MRKRILLSLSVLLSTLSFAQDTLRSPVVPEKIKPEYPTYNALAFSGVYASDLESSNPGVSFHYMRRSYKPFSVLYGIGVGALAPDLDRRQELYFLEGRIGTNVQIKRIAHIRIALVPGVQYTDDHFEPLLGFEAGQGFNLWNVELGVSLGMNTFYTESMFYGRIHLGYIFSPNKRVLPQ